MTAILLRFKRVYATFFFWSLLLLDYVLLANLFCICAIECKNK